MDMNQNADAVLVLIFIGIIATSLLVRFLIKKTLFNRRNAMLQALQDGDYANMIAVLKDLKIVDVTDLFGETETEISATSFQLQYAIDGSCLPRYGYLELASCVGSWLKNCYRNGVIDEVEAHTHIANELYDSNLSDKQISAFFKRMASRHRSVAKQLKGIYDSVKAERNNALAEEAKQSKIDRAVARGKKAAGWKPAQDFSDDLDSEWT